MEIDFDFGIITLIELKENLDGQPARFVQCQVTDAQDAQLVELIMPPGDSSAPSIGSSVFIIDVGGRRVGFLLNAGIVSEVPPGTKQIYSSSGGAQTSTLSMQPNGTIVVAGGEIYLNGNTDFAVRFNALQSVITAAVQEAVNAQLALIATEINDLGGSYTPTPLAVDLTPAKVLNVKML